MGTSGPARPVARPAPTRPNSTASALPDSSGVRDRFPWMRSRCSTRSRLIWSPSSWWPKPNASPGCRSRCTSSTSMARRLVRLAGSREFPAHFDDVVALGGEIPPDGFAALESRLAEQFPGSAPYPMMVRGRAIGVLVAVRQPGGSLRELARQGAAAIELTSAYTDVFEGGRRTRQPSPAAELQLGLLPPRIMSVTGAELAGSLVPAYESGGDWFDFADNHDGAWFAIADPKGRGPVSTALGALALSALRSARRSDATLEDAVTVHGPDRARSRGARIHRQRAGRPLERADLARCLDRLRRTTPDDRLVRRNHPATREPNARGAGILGAHGRAPTP